VAASALLNSLCNEHHTRHYAVGPDFKRCSFTGVFGGVLLSMERFKKAMASIDTEKLGKRRLNRGHY